MALLLASVSLLSTTGAGGTDSTPESAVPAPSSARVIQQTDFDTSPPLAIMTATTEVNTRLTMPKHAAPAGLNRVPEGWDGIVGRRHSAHVVQTESGSGRGTAETRINVEGLGKGTPGYYWLTPPPDTTGAAGPEHFLQWVNTHFMLFNRTDGSVVDLPGDDWRAGNTIWAGFGGPCETRNDGDPIVIWDQLAQRWFMSQLAVHQSFPAGPFFQCIAVSTTADPLGPWHRYSYEWPGNKLNDYPKFGLWTDGYYMTVNEFQEVTLQWEGAGVAVFERDRMLDGDPAVMIYWDLGTEYGVLLPLDLDGSTEPPPGSTGYLFGLYIDLTGDDYLGLWKVDVDWADPPSSTLGGPGNAPNAIIPVSEISPANQIEQPGPGLLDVIGDRLMYRAPYRNFGTHESILLNHTVGDPAGIRWYEIRDPGGTPLLFQEGTYSPDGENRWMGDLAMDTQGNIALGYNLSGPTTSPSIRVTGRLATDPPGQMTVPEIHIQDGSGYQTSSSRWGDYSTMAVDPVDDCTLWYTQEYIASSGYSIWQTRVAALRFDSCIVVEIFADGFEGGDTTRWSSTTP